MSVSIYVAARRKVSQDDFELVFLYNGLLNRGLPIPDKMVDQLEKLLGEDLFEAGVPVEISEGTSTVEIILEGEGNVMHGSGEVIKIEDIPPDTIELRIYAQA